MSKIGFRAGAQYLHPTLMDPQRRPAETTVLHWESEGNVAVITGDLRQARAPTRRFHVPSAVPLVVGGRSGLGMVVVTRAADVGTTSITRCFRPNPRGFITPGRGIA